MSIDLTVRGSHTSFAPPERATVTLSVAIDGPDSTDAYTGVAATADAVRRSLELLHDPGRGPVTWWASGQISTWSSRPWNQDGKVLPLVHHARVTFSVKFSDFGRLSDWLAATVGLPGAEVVRIEWALTASHRQQVLTEVRRAAVHDAIAKAQVYADAVDAGRVRVLAIADAGMLGGGLQPTEDHVPRFSRMAAAGGTPSISLVPEDVETAVQVDVRCIAG